MSKLEKIGTIADIYMEFLVSETFKNSPVNKKGELVKVQVISGKYESFPALIPVKALFAAVSCLSIGKNMRDSNIVILNDDDEPVFRFIIQNKILWSGILEDSNWSNDYLPEFVVG